MSTVRRTIAFNKLQRGFLRALFLILLIVLAIYFFLQSSFFNLTKIEIEGNKLLQKKEVEQFASIPYGINIFKISRDKIKDKLMLHYLIDDIDIKMKLPQTLEIKVKERKPLFLVPNKETFLVIDYEGICIKKVNQISNLKMSVVTGFKDIKEIELGEKIEDAKLKKIINFIKQIPDEYKPLLMEIECKEINLFYVYTYDGTEVRFGDSNNIQKKIVLLNYVVKNNLIKNKIVDYIDVSTITPVIRYKN